MSNLPVYTAALRSAHVQATIAKTVFTDASNTVQLSTAGAAGSIFKRVTASSRATLGANMVCMLYKSSNSGGTLFEVASAIITAGARDATHGAPAIDFGYTTAAPLRLGVGETLYVAIGAAGTVDFVAEGEDF